MLEKRITAKPVTISEHHLIDSKTNKGTCECKTAKGIKPNTATEKLVFASRKFSSTRNHQERTKRFPY
jgi:hypothetical protein